MKLQRTLLLSLALAALCAVPTRAQVTVPAADRVSTTRGADLGLNGLYWQRAPVSILTTGATIASQIDTFGAPTGTFVAHNFAFAGNDLTQVNGAFGSGPWLGVDAPSFTGPATSNLDDGAFSFRGFLFIPTAGTYNFGALSDDGSSIRIGSVTDILGGANEGSHADITTTVAVTFSSAGLYPLRVDYFNGDWTSEPANNNHSGSPDPGVHGGANFQILQDGAPIVETNLYRNIPEPSAVALGLAGVGGVLALRRRRR
jgi:PA14 domain/PEP-CTERM motif